MSPGLLATLAAMVLGLHVAIILFNVIGLIVIPLGAWRGWAFVRIVWWRALHIAVLAIVALQALLAKLCFLTEWQDALLRRAGEAVSDQPLIARWVNWAIYWPLPLWAFALMYLAAWIASLLLWWLVRPAQRGR